MCLVQPQSEKQSEPFPGCSGRTARPESGEDRSFIAPHSNLCVERSRQSSFPRACVGVSYGTSRVPEMVSPAAPFLRTWPSGVLVTETSV